MFRLRYLLCILLLTTPADACLNDRDSDTLATEGKGLPDVVQVITGRFPRNPPLFYEMRLARVSKQIAAQPANLGLYDDAAVACDRLHRDKEAIAWMARKRAQLKPFPQDKEHWYRYHANLGTVQAHDWLRSGANRKNLSEMKSARDHIAEAMKINPNAHFGREKYQLMAMNWIIKPPKADIYEGKIESFEPFITFNTEKFEPADAVKGISGLIVLGDAWESVDVFQALYVVFVQRDDGTLAQMTMLRCHELIQKGRKSLFPGAPAGKALYEIITRGESVELTDGYEAIVKNDYAQRRQEADEFQRRRTEFMMPKLKAGRHPDIDPKFWDGWVDKGAPDLPDDGAVEKWFKRNIWVGIIWYLFIFPVAPIWLAIVLWRKRKARLKDDSCA